MASLEQLEARLVGEQADDKFFSNLRKCLDTSRARASIPEESHNSFCGVLGAFFEEETTFVVQDKSKYISCVRVSLMDNLLAEDLHGGEGFF